MIKKASPRFTLTKSAELGEERYSLRLSCGLEIIYLPRRGFADKFALFSTRYGSIDSWWKRPNGRTRRVPDGIAHFLEHQLFKKAEGDLTNRFTANGASCNAMTMHTATVYYFEGVSDFSENLELLLQLCLTSYFDQGLVDTERGIITQEIVSYRDHPYWVTYQKLLMALYKRHPVRVDIAGDEDSVARIGPKLLEECHRRFYHPANCALVIAGDLDPEDLAELAENLVDRHFDGRARERIARPLTREPAGVSDPRVEFAGFATLPRLLIGYKDISVLRGAALVRAETVAGITLDLLFGRGTPFFDDLYRDGIASGDFSAGYHAEPGFGHVIMGGETSDPEELERRIDVRFAEARKEGFSAEELARKKNKIRGRFLRNFETPDACAFAHNSAWISEVDLFTYLRTVENISLADLEKCMQSLFHPRRRAVALLRKP